MALPFSNGYGSSHRTFFGASHLCCQRVLPHLSGMEYVPRVFLVCPGLPAEVPCSWFITSALPAAPFTAFRSRWERQVNVSRWFFFFLNQRNIAYVNTQLYRPYSRSKTRFFGDCLFSGIIHFTDFNQTVTRISGRAHCERIAAGRRKRGSCFCWRQRALELAPAEWQRCCRGTPILREAAPVRVLHCSDCRLTSRADAPAAPREPAESVALVPPNSSLTVRAFSPGWPLSAAPCSA